MITTRTYKDSVMYGQTANNMKSSIRASGVGAAGGSAQATPEGLKLFTSQEDVEGCKDFEFSFRKKMLRKRGGERIHHFNWEGKAVCSRSNTPPEHSLFIIMSQPKVIVKGASNEIWQEVVMRRAMEYVDPVVIYSNGADIPTDSQGLLRFANNRTLKFYSDHGSWRTTMQEGEGILGDEGDVEFYMYNDVGVGNGFVECSGVKSRYKWYKERQILQSTTHPMKRKRKRDLPTRIEDLNPPCEPSCLRHCIAADEL